MLASWAEGLGQSRTGAGGRGCLRFAFYGRVSTEDWQDPVTSRARQLQQAVMLVSGRGVIVADFFDAGQSRTLPWARRPQAAALVGQLADPDRGWDAIVIGEYERAFYGSQYALMPPLFEHYGIGLWMPEVGGRVDWHAEDHEQTMLALGLSSKREITRTRIRVRTAMAAQTREQGRYLGGRPPYGYRLADAGPHPNKAHAAWGRRAHRLEPDPVTAPVILGLIISLHPSGSLNVIAVLIGVLLVISGIFHLVRVFDRSEPYRVWLGIAGLLLVVIGVILIRHLNLTVALVGLVIGVTWLVQGLASLVTAFSGGTGERRGWWIFFGLVSLIAGIMVTAVSATSVTVLAVLVGIWFIAGGLVEIVGGFMQRHAASTSQASHGQPAPSW